MSEQLRVYKNRVLEAASKCPQAAATLKELFPEAFEPGGFNLYKLSLSKDACLFTEAQARAAGFKSSDFMMVRDSGKYQKVAFYLATSNYTWRLENDEGPCLCLIPTKL